ncbi:type II toxin-antitoxin system prevent-host-death family antitoxin [Streptomyces hoynatensis]|uniref:Type II toxin-antitoxin system prevent-host-death family antitoxin n=2 Tax=Streptomyces hoynatensis TaxID=1141874 RepID=A0A3A9ZHU8_9ACTN|nr:type II toxin-antitoxin system prevent-host-death family antitoxin [Streptomyces hoynatensis]
MTATEVARNFASVLDRAEHGETIVITRGGRRLATLSPAPAGNGAAIKEFLAEHPVDEDFPDDVAAARESITDEMSGAWHDD